MALMFDDLLELPWPELKLPDYAEAEMGEWTLTKQNVPLLRGYFNGLQPVMHANWLMKKGKTIWMSLTPMELESQALHAASAYGHTVIMGFGMGMLAYNVLQNPKVTKVTVIELERDTVRLIEKSTDMEAWPNIEKLWIRHEDALKWTPDKDEVVDVVLADIWPLLGDTKLRPDMQTMERNIKPQLMAAWGMELDYITWMSDQGYVAGNEDLDTYEAYMDDIGLPLIGLDYEEYPALALEASKNALLY